MLYLPAAAGVMTGVVVLPPEVLLDVDPPEPPQPVEPPMIPTERITANNAPQRRRRGSTRRNMQASVAPEPAMYQGVLGAEWLEAILSREVALFALLWKADKVKVTEVGEFELRVMVSAGVEAGEKA